MQPGAAILEIQKALSTMLEATKKGLKISQMQEDLQSTVDAVMRDAFVWNGYQNPIRVSEDLERRVAVERAVRASENGLSAGTPIVLNVAEGTNADEMAKIRTTALEILSARGHSRAVSVQISSEVQAIAVRMNVNTTTPETVTAQAALSVEQLAAVAHGDARITKAVWALSGISVFGLVSTYLASVEGPWIVPMVMGIGFGCDVPKATFELHFE